MTFKIPRLHLRTRLIFSKSVTSTACSSVLNQFSVTAMIISGASASLIFQRDAIDVEVP
jgi:hypothetical protein